MCWTSDVFSPLPLQQRTCLHILQARSNGVNFFNFEILLDPLPLVLPFEEEIFPPTLCVIIRKELMMDSMHPVEAREGMMKEGV